jgi:hypothetical protein
LTLANEENHVDFVWIDRGGALWRVCLRGKVERLHYWNDFSMSWVQLRPVSWPDDAWMLDMPWLPAEQAALYNLMSGKHGGPG